MSHRPLDRWRNRRRKPLTRRCPGHFARWRACHGTRYHEADVVCAGFYARRGADCTPIQLAERLGGIVKVEGDA